MRAAVCRAFGEPLVVEDVVLDPPGPGELEVEVAACAICHSDIIYAEGGWGGALPAVYGHEAAGVVTGVGTGARGFEAGDHVVVTLIRSCGSCPACAQGTPVTCETRFALDSRTPLRESDGQPLGQGLRTAALAEYVVVDASQAVAVPDSLPLDSASLLACGVITGVGAVTNTAALRPGTAAVVIGAGGVGLNTIQGAAIAGARIVVALDVSMRSSRRPGGSAPPTRCGPTAQESSTRCGACQVAGAPTTCSSRSARDRRSSKPSAWRRARAPWCSSAFPRRASRSNSNRATSPRTISGFSARRWGVRASGTTSPSSSRCTRRASSSSTS